MTRLAMLVALLIAAGCSGTSAPTPTPGGMDDAIANLVLRGVTIRRLVSGDPGCPTSDLHDNAVHLEASFAAQSSLKQIYLFQWRRASDFDAATEAFNDCVAEYEAGLPGVEVATVSASPWRAYGANWGEDLTSIIEAALVESASN